MDPKVVETLAIAEQFMHNARFAGAPRQAIADGFSSIDALFSAVLLEVGIEPPRNHKKKLDAVRVHAPSIFETRSEQVESGWSYMGGIEWAILEQFYREWLESRYERFDMTAGEVRGRIAVALGANYFVTRWLTDKNGTDWLELHEQVARQAYGYSQSATSDALSTAHDALFSEAERLGERVGRKLAIKMSSTTNFCDADMVAGDALTRSIIKEDRKIARLASRVYVDFCKLMDRIRFERAERLMQENPEFDYGAAFDAATDFMFSMKARYHGERLSDTGQMISELLTHSISRTIDEREQRETNAKD